MPASKSNTATLDEAVGVIQEVDVLGRTLTVLVNGVPRVFDVAPDCPVVLHGERVKLRLVQPEDHVHVIYGPAPAGLLAQAVEVDWRLPGLPEGQSAQPSQDRPPSDLQSDGLRDRI